MKLSIVIIVLIVLTGICIFALKTNAGPSLHKQTRFLMDTYCTIQVYGSSSETEAAMAAALDRIEEIDKKFNFLNPSSPLYAFNLKNTPINDPEIIGLIKVAQKVSEQSDGVFDITVQPLVELWGFYSQSLHVPKKKEIADCLKKIGYKNLIIQDNQVRSRKSGIRIDLGGIAKGYALGEALKVLKTYGVDSALIDAGGDIYVAGKIKGGNWTIGIRNPRGEGDIGVLQVSDLAVVTSGDYERFFIQDGIRYCHIMDPHTGYPPQDVISVTIVCDDPVLAVAWTKPLFLLGVEGMKLVEEIPNMEAIVVTADKKIVCSAGLMKALVYDKKDLVE